MNQYENYNPMQYQQQNDKEDEIVFETVIVDDYLLPEGAYDAKCVDVRVTRKDNKEMLILEWMVLNDPHQNKRVAYFGRLEPANVLWRLNNDLKKIGGQLSDKEFIDPVSGKTRKKKSVSKSQFIGKTARVKVEHFESRDGSKKAQVRDFLD